MKSTSPATKRARRKFSWIVSSKPCCRPGSLDVGGSPEFRIRKVKEDVGGTAFADYVWKPVVLVWWK
jgi:hypothetical protein